MEWKMVSLQVTSSIIGPCTKTAAAASMIYTGILSKLLINRLGWNFLLHLNVLGSFYTFICESAETLLTA
jgi:hypothetical protein